MSRVLEAVRMHAAASDAIALSDGDSSLSYSGLAREIDATADRLRRLLSENGRARVGVEVENGIAWVVLDLALLSLGCCTVPIPAFFTAAQRDHALKSAGVEHVVLRFSHDSLGQLERFAKEVAPAFTS